MVSAKAVVNGIRCECSKSIAVLTRKHTVPYLKLPPDSCLMEDWRLGQKVTVLPPCNGFLIHGEPTAASENCDVPLFPKFLWIRLVW